MSQDVKQRDKVRVQVDLTTADVSLLELLQSRLAVRSRADLLRQAYRTFLWLVDEMLSGRRIVSVEPEMLDRLERFKELSVPVVGPLVFEHYRHLVMRPEKGRQQLYLKGRNMTVGQLMYKMRANQLTADQAAEDMDLPLEQVMEARAYYHTHRELIESEMEEEKQYLLSHGVKLEPIWRALVSPSLVVSGR